MVNAWQVGKQWVNKRPRVQRDIGVLWLVLLFSWAATQQLQMVAELEVVSNVAGAEIFINGTATAVVPAATGRTVLELRPGSYTVQLAAPSYNPPARDVVLVTGETVTLEFIQETVDARRVGSAVIQGNVPNASVFVNGEQVGSLDATGQLRLDNLAPGRYDVRLTAPDYAEQTGGVTVFLGEVAVLELTQPQTETGSLRIVSGLASATVFLDGEQVGMITDGEFRRENLEVGDYVMRIEAPDFSPLEQTITINRDQTTTLDIGR